MTALLHLHYEARYATRSMGAFIMLAVSAAVGFLLWYALVRQAGALQHKDQGRQGREDRRTDHAWRQRDICLPVPETLQGRQDQ